MSLDVTSHAGTNSLEAEIDPIWTSSRTARQIYALGEVEKVHLLCFSSIALQVRLQGHTGHQSLTLLGGIFNLSSHFAPNGRTRCWIATRRRTIRAIRTGSQRIF